MSKKEAVHKYWKSVIEEEVKAKTTLAYLNIEYTGKPHSIWQATAPNSRDVRRANNKARLLTGTYILQANKASFNQTSNTTCLMCKVETEDVCHFIIKCPYLEEIRQPILNQIKDTVPYIFKYHPSLWSPPQLTQLVLDPTHHSIQALIPLPPCMIVVIERLTRKLCYRLHTNSCLYMGQTP